MPPPPPRSKSAYRPYPGGGGPKSRTDGGSGGSYAFGGGMPGFGLAIDTRARGYSQCVLQWRWSLDGGMTTYCPRGQSGPIGQNPVRYSLQATRRICLRGQVGPVKGARRRGTEMKPCRREHELRKEGATGSGEEREGKGGRWTGKDVPSLQKPRL